MPDSIMPQIKTIVFLMMENRSLDNLLGWLYENSNPDRVFPPDSRKDYDGLQTGSYSNPRQNNPGQLVPVTKVSDIRWREIRSKQWGVPYYDPWEALRAYPNDPRQPYSWSGVMNQFYGDAKIIDGMPVTKDGHPAMQGFYKIITGPRWRRGRVKISFGRTGRNSSTRLTPWLATSPSAIAGSAQYRPKRIQTALSQFVVPLLDKRITGHIESRPLTSNTTP